MRLSGSILNIERRSISPRLFPWNFDMPVLTTPQGFDPCCPEQYRVLIVRVAHFETNRLFYLNPANVDTLRLLGAAYFISSESGPAVSTTFLERHFHLDAT